MRQWELRIALICSILGLSLFAPILAGRIQGPKAKDERPCGLVYGKSHAFWVCPPKGWVIDNSVLKDQGIFATFYPAGSSFEKARDSGTFMYVNTAGKHEGQATVADLMKGDAERTSSANPKVKVREVSPIKIDDGEARVQQFEHSAFDRFEAVAYIDSPEVLVLITITSRDERSFQRDYPAFKELVRSYKFWTTQVKIDTK